MSTLPTENLQIKVLDLLIRKTHIIASAFKVIAIPEIPKNEAGKILYSKLIQRITDYTMTNLEKYNEAFTTVFSVSAKDLNDEFNAGNIDSWDSVHQLSIVAQLEEIFDVMFDPEDILGLTSYAEGKKILSKYNVEL